MNFIEYNQLPDGILELSASALHQMLDGPSLIHLEGRRKRPLVISVLQHGNEDTGWEAVRRLIKNNYLFDELPRSLLLFIGNVQAARHRVRRLDDQPDYNRCWPSGSEMDTDSPAMFRQVMDRMLEYDPWACVDIHNNTGLNPHYAAVNRVHPDHLRLAACFAPQVVYFTRPAGTMSHAFSVHIPSSTLECGQAGNVHGTDHTMAYLETLLHIDDLSSLPLSTADVQLFHMRATVTVPHDVAFDFGASATELTLRDDLDSLNFQELPPHTAFGRVSNGNSRPVRAIDIRGRDVTPYYFSVEDGELVTARPIMPSMLTLDRRVIQQDCLCYLMERLDYDADHEPMEIDPLPDSIPRITNPGGPGAG
ncbi:MAG TPA: M14 family metallopeptidase [Xanthomonadales bacterium]|nr:M14 family metallopeptidase [Xanthomonadales bacterium]